MSIFSIDGLINMLISLPAIILAIGLHEYAHALVAYKLGDPTPKMQGRLTMDPFKHIDILGILSLLIVHIGWGKPVETNTRNFKKPFRDLMITALAGPAMNFLLAIIFAGVLKMWLVFDWASVFNEQIGTILQGMLSSVVLYNVMLGVFNLLPIPPLDGSRVLLYLLPYSKKHIYEKLERYSLFIIIAIFVTGIADIIIFPVATFVLNAILMIYGLQG